MVCIKHARWFERVGLWFVRRRMKTETAGDALKILVAINHCGVLKVDEALKQAKAEACGRSNPRPDPGYRHRWARIKAYLPEATQAYAEREFFEGQCE